MKRITFSDTFYKVAVFLGGDLPDFSVFQLSERTIKIAADGAANRMIHNYCPPNIIIGDMDSLQITQGELLNIKLIKDNDEETNDFEKIFKYLQKNNYHSIIICGIHGGELEHTLNNLSVLMKYQALFDVITIYDKNRYGVLIDTSIEINLEKGETISIIPNPLCNISTNGLYWELSDETLALGAREGARNKCKSSKIVIELNYGSYYLFIESRFPKLMQLE
ncbi:MAG TPA: thiamine diphosphokinase [Candidatus Kapabacteria bacterium]|nr:thiamine diphosphokinase [Candidatus Kapabacteria bacterium]